MAEAIVVARWAFFAAAMAAFGMALFPYYAGAEARRGWIVAAAAAALAASVAWLGLMLVSFGATDLGSAEAIGRIMLLETRFGVWWLVRLGAAGLLVVAAALGWRAPSLILAGVVLGSQGFMGHAAAAQGPLAAATVSVHLIAAGAWFGGLVPLARVLRTNQPDAEVRVLLRFSAMGMAAVAIIVVSGVADAWLITGRVPDPALRYDQILLIKVGLVLAMIAVAAINRFRLLRDENGLARIRWTVGLEQGIGLLVLLAASVLGMSDPHA